MKLTKKTYSFAKNSDKTMFSKFGLDELNALRERYELEKKEPLYREVVFLRSNLGDVSSQWFGYSEMVNAISKSKVNPTAEPFASIKKSCKQLFELKELLEKQLKKAEKAWSEREKEIANERPSGLGQSERT